MKKIDILALSLLLFSLFACTNVQNNDFDKANIRNDDSEVKQGDCFLFKDSTLDFGLVVLKVEGTAAEKEYYLIPVEVASSGNGLSKIRNGNVYLKPHQHESVSEESREGFHCFMIYRDDRFTSISSKLLKVGRVEMQSRYLSWTGLVLTRTYDDIKDNLIYWDQLVGENGRKIVFRNVLKGGVDMETEK